MCGFRHWRNLLGQSSQSFIGKEPGPVVIIAGRENCVVMVLQCLPVIVKSGLENFHSRARSEGEEQAFLRKDGYGGGGGAVGEGQSCGGQRQSPGGGGRAVREGDRNFSPLLRISGHLGALNGRIQTEASY